MRRMESMIWTVCKTLNLLFTWILSDSSSILALCSHSIYFTQIYLFCFSALLWFHSDGVNHFSVKSWLWEEVTTFVGFP